VIDGPVRRILQAFNQGAIYSGVFAVLPCLLVSTAGYSGDQRRGFHRPSCQPDAQYKVVSPYESPWPIGHARRNKEYVTDCPPWHLGGRRMLSFQLVIGTEARLAVWAAWPQ